MSHQRRGGERSRFGRLPKLTRHKGAPDSARCGWRTRAMFDGYNIIDEADLAAAVAKRFANGKAAAKQEAPATPAERLS